MYILDHFAMQVEEAKTGELNFVYKQSWRGILCHNKKLHRVWSYFQSRSADKVFLVWPLSGTTPLTSIGILRWYICSRQVLLYLIFQNIFHDAQFRISIVSKWPNCEGDTCVTLAGGKVSATHGRCNDHLVTGHFNWHLRTWSRNNF